jgi:hypothetical protein
LRREARPLHCLQGKKVNKQRALVAIALLACNAFAFAQTPPVSPAPPSAVDAGESAYVGADTRVGLGYDDKTKLRGELYRVFSESDTSALLGEAWLSRNAGGVKLSYNWLPDAAKPAMDSAVRKFFIAADRNTEGDAKVTIGGGFETSRFLAASTAPPRSPAGAKSATTRLPPSETIQGTTAGRSCRTSRQQSGRDCSSAPTITASAPGSATSMTRHCCV